MVDAVIHENKAAELLGVSPRTLQRYRVQGSGPKFLKIGKKVFYTEVDLQKYLDSCRRQSTSEAA